MHSPCSDNCELWNCLAVFLAFQLTLEGGLWALLSQLILEAWKASNCATSKTASTAMFTMQLKETQIFNFFFWLWGVGRHLCWRQMWTEAKLNWALRPAVQTRPLEWKCRWWLHAISPPPFRERNKWEWLWRDTQTCSCYFKGNDTAVEYQDEILRHIVRLLAGGAVPGFLVVHDNICSSCGCVYLQFLDGTPGICPDIVGSTHTLMSSSFGKIQGFILIWWLNDSNFSP